MNEDLLRELWNVKDELAAEAGCDVDLLPLAQTAWAADWDRPEEDEAWRDL